MDLIEAQTEAGQRLALQQLRGHLSEQVEDARSALLGVVARIEASIDFPEDDVPTPVADELCPLITKAQQCIDGLLAGSEQGRLYRQGLRTAIIGRPNVGKSSLLNALLRTERAIVTPIAGTTRDTVEEVANLRGIPLHLIDTAGITPTNDPVEQMGVQRSRAAAETADLVLLVFDGSEPLTSQDRRVSDELYSMGFGSHGTPPADTSSQSAEMPTLEAHEQRPVILIINKADRAQTLELEDVRHMWPHAPCVSTSILTGQGLSELEESIADLVSGGKTLHSSSVLITSARHQEALRRASAHLRASQTTLKRGEPLDFVSI